jgi:hypothetical protein
VYGGGGGVPLVLVFDEAAVAQSLKALEGLLIELATYAIFDQLLNSPLHLFHSCRPPLQRMDERLTHKHTPHDTSEWRHVPLSTRSTSRRASMSCQVTEQTRWGEQQQQQHDGMGAAQAGQEVLR